MDTFRLDSFMNSFRYKLEYDVRQHLKQVYTCLAMSSLAAAGGAYVHLFTGLLSGGLLTLLASIGLLLALVFTPDNGKNHTRRLGYLLGFAFLSGLNMGPLLDLVIRINPSLIVTALMGTCLLFVSFSISALLAERGSMLFLGGTLLTLMSTMSLMLFANIFLGSRLIFQVELYLGLIVMSGFVLYDTQLICEKRRNGDKDFIFHSIDLFIDLINIFRHLLVILSQREDQRKRRKD